MNKSNHNCVPVPYSAKHPINIILGDPTSNDGWIGQNITCSDILLNNMPVFQLARISSMKLRMNNSLYNHVQILYLMIRQISIDQHYL
jgi:hypothetical protein